VIRGLSDGDRIVAQPEAGMYSGAQVGN